MALNRYLTFATFFLVGAASAESGCPPGQLPAQANGAMASCTPVPPGYYQQQAPAPQPLGKWLTTWGAIAMGSIDNTTNYGVTTGKLSKAEAEADALRRCASHGEKDCQIALSYHNQCAAIAEPQTNGLPLAIGLVSFSGGVTITDAIQRAQAHCRKANAATSEADCKVIYKACTEQIFEKF
ncbi:DUF4189 domain-containing protein [Xanthomonas sp. LMG 12459]|uniref:DUF4189 domain-containing protein n=1 Tax=Xanthomonas sp. LMG 12459 TaxID=1591131 RepID=UPI00186B4855|nr:DUF4189 domain-containing protein [Xanthomonas sp. LMG 12459]